jgi:hypothetical protein
MNTARQQVEALAGMVVLPMTLAARLLGVSPRNLATKLPILDAGYRSQGGTSAALRAYLDSIETTPNNSPRTLRIIQPTNSKP